MSNDKSYKKECKFCKQTILMSKETGEWLPYNLNNGPHDCRNNGNGKEKPITKQEKEEITLQAVQKKLAEIGIIINVERLMAC